MGTKPKTQPLRYLSGGGVAGSSLDSNSEYGPGFQHASSRPDHGSGRSSRPERRRVARPGGGDPPIPGGDGLQDGWPPRPQSRRGRADPGAPPGVREPQGPDPMGYRPPGIRSQAADPPA